MNAQVTHTPGPWQVFQHDGGVLILSAKRDTIAEVFAVHDTASGIGEANARLIASAPKLLEALNQIVNCIKPDQFRNDPTFAAIRDLANAAIVKATGEKS